MSATQAAFHTSAAILSVGDELALGQTLDTNSRWISEQLVSRGLTVVEHVTVPDDAARQAAAFARLAGEADLVISSGGLGPTADDLTRAALATASGDELVEDPEALAQVRAWFEKRSRPMPELNRVQALRPSRGRSLRNDHGTAPGLHAVIQNQNRSCDVYCLPGPPSEMKPMFAGAVVPSLRPGPGRIVLTRTYPCVGIGESDLATRLGPLMDRERVPLVGTTASNSVVSVRVRYEGDASEEEAASLLGQTEAQVLSRAGEFVFAHEDVSLEAVVLRELSRRKQRLAVVESCTGGLLAASLTAVPGSSEAFVGGWITYTNERKHKDVGVPLVLFKETGPPDAPGAVSAQVASAMARGGIATAGVDYALAITGIAGPSGGTPDKPVGTVWISLAYRVSGGVHADTRRFHMTTDRDSVRVWSARSALAMLWTRLAERPQLRLLREAERSQ
jgi:nicotinamide-nucleotide amidase